MSSNPFQSVGKNLLLISTGGMLAVYGVKYLIRARKESQFDPYSNRSDHPDGYYDNLAHIKPGFPLPKSNDHEPISERKSEYEGTGMSVLSRKSGDRLGFLDRRGGE